MSSFVDVAKGHVHNSLSFLAISERLTDLTFYIPRIQLNLYKRGTAHLALGHTKKALDDFEAVLALTEFDQVCHRQ
jgi:hypothetical protein